MIILIHDQQLSNVSDLTLNTIKNKKIYSVGQCCVENGVADNCLGLCVEKHIASLKRQSPFIPNVCEQYQDIIHNCTTPLPTGKFHMHQK